jgi:ADP-ribose pyrophosphatase YjhB (NUDIX family)
LKKNSNRRNPLPAVDVIIRYMDGVLLIKRKNPPFGWALPGGFVDCGESLEEAAVREVREETGLAVTLLRQFHTYSDPSRDPRQHTISTVFCAEGSGRAEAADDAAGLGVFREGDLPDTIAFDHRQILNDYFLGRY